MIGLVTDRNGSNITRLQALSSKGWARMTPAERAEWSGDPFTASNFAYGSAVNILPDRQDFSVGATLKHRNTSVTATVTDGGANRYGVTIIGEAADFAGKTVTLSLRSVYSEGGTPLLSLYWYDANGAESTGVALSSAGSTTVALGANTGGRAYLAMYIYAATSTTATAGAWVRYNGIMLERGATAHEFVPYVEVLPTLATKGAYNYSDLNRVEKIVAELAELLGVAVATKTNWTVWDIPTPAEMKRYLGNIEVLRNACPNRQNVPAIPSGMSNLTYEISNTIEEILSAIYENTCAVYRVGELYCGEV